MRYVRAETTGRTCGEKGTRGAAAEEQEETKGKMTYGLECAEGLRGAGTSQRIRGPYLKQKTVCGTTLGEREDQLTVQIQKQGHEHELRDENR